jgi:hypothetical protein
MPLYLDESRRGQVLAVSGDGSERFVNQSVELFGQCLALFENYRRVVRSVPDEQADPIIASTEAELHKADPAAFKNDENWWPLVVEQMNHGLL